MKVSVVICNYNYGRFIGKTIDSVLSQVYEDFELIIVDDGSTDNSREIIDSYQDERIIKIFKENGGQASAFNTGFAASEGDLVCLLDSDDWWSDGKLETIIRWDEFIGSDYSILQHGLTVWSDGETSPYKLTLPTGNCFSEMCETGKIDFFVPTSGLTIPRRICEKVFPLPETLRICADAFLTRTSIAFGNVISVPEILGYYRKHRNTVYKNSEFSAQQFFDNQLFPLLKQFYEENNIKVPRICIKSIQNDQHTPYGFFSKFIRKVKQ